MKVEDFYCCHCGYEDNDIEVEYSYSCANGDIVICPLCKGDVLVDPEEEDWEE